MAIIMQHWNKVVRPVDEGVKARDYIGASDIGRPFIDRYLKMEGVTPTNPYPERVLRIFNAGKVIEYIVVRTLAMAGILNKKQAWVEVPATKNTLRVVGYLDATIGGFPNWDVVRRKIDEHVEEFDLDIDDDIVADYSTKLVEGMMEEYPNGWQEEMLVEVKSINSMAFHKKGMRDALGNFLGYDHNKLQLYAYLKATKIKNGILLYVSKDDFTMAEVPVSLGDAKLRSEFNRDVRQMTKYYLTKEKPPKLEEISYNDKNGKFEINWEVSRSPYLTLIYGYENEDVLEAKNHQLLLDLNRAMKHLGEGKVKPEDETLIKLWDMDKKLEEYQNDTRT